MVRAFSWAGRLVAFVALVAWGCAGQRAEDERVCAGHSCTAGMCVSDHGTPTCVCGAFEQAAHLSCVLLDQNFRPETATLLPTDAGALEQTLGPVPTGVGTEWWFRFDAAPNTWYAIDARSDELPDLYLRGMSGFFFAPTPDSLYFKAADGGTGLFSVRSESTPQGHYTLDVHSMGMDEAGEDAEHAAPLGLESPSGGALQVLGDVDVYSLQLTAGRAYRLDCAGPDGGSCSSLSWSADWNNQFTSEWRQSRYYVPSESGPHVLRLWAGSTGGSEAVPYALELFDLGVDPGAPANATPVPPDGGVSTLNDLFPGLPAAFSYATQPEDVYWAQLSGPGQCTASPEIYTADDAGTALITITAREEGGCDLRVVDVGPDDFPNQEGVGTPIGPGTLQVQTQYPGDLDSVRLPVEARRAYEVVCDVGCQISHEPWYMSSGRSWDGRYYWSASDGTFAFSLGGVLGPHALTTVAVPDDVLHEATLSPGASFNGQLEWHGDTDSFGLETSSGATYQVDFDSAGPIRLIYGDNSQYLRVATQGPVTITGDGSRWALVIEYATDNPPEDPTAYSIQVAGL